MRRAFLWASLAALAAAGEEPGREDAARDLEVARRIAAALPVGDVALVDFLRKLEPSETREDRNIGFGARRVRVAIHGEHTTTEVTVLAFKDRVGPLQVLCRGDEAVWETLGPEVAKAYGRKAALVDRKGLSLRIGSPADPAGFCDARKEVLGPRLKEDPHPDLEDAYYYLWSPLHDVVYGWQQGDGGEEPEGRKAIEKILAHESGQPLLLDLLRCPNPESRLYAAEALLRMERKGATLPEEVRRAIDWVSRSDVPIQVCEGCEISWKRATDALKAVMK